MTKRKLKFNAVDALIILLIAAVIFVLAYIFILSENKDDSTAENYKTIQYVIEVNNIEERFAESVKEGQAVQDAVQRKNIGTVVGVQPVEYRKSGFDYENNVETVSSVEDKITLKITIEAQAVDTERAFIVDGCEIRVGQRYSLILPEMYGVGYCVFLTENQ